MQNLRVSEETTDSFRVSWQPAPGAVIRYQLTYEPVGDESSKLVMTTDGPETTTVLQELQPKTTYRVTVIPEYQSGSGAPLQTDGTTKEGECNFHMIYEAGNVGSQGAPLLLITESIQNTDDR